MGEKSYYDLARLEAQFIEEMWLRCDEYYSILAFHCEQVAEKLLKDLVEVNGEVPSDTHNIPQLLGYAYKQGWVTKPPKCVTKAAANLVSLYAASRYITTLDITIENAYQAVCDCNIIADFLSENSCRSVRIEVGLSYLHEEG